ncbi:MAG: ROK family protein [Microbacterium sp.]
MRIGLDIGGTKVAATLVDAEGHVRARSWNEHSARGIDAVSRLLAETAAALPGAPTSAPVGVSVAGLVRRDGSVAQGATLDLNGDLAAALRGRLPNPVGVCNDAEATLRAVLHDRRLSHGEDVTDAVLLAIGTGIGGAIVTAGRSIRGRAGLATELGHAPVAGPTGEPCVCGSSGCLEQYAGGRGLAALARRAVLDGTASDALRTFAEAAETIAAKDVVRLAREADATSLGLLDQAAVLCARAIRALCVTVEPDIVFLGGSIAHGAADILVPRIEESLRALWPFASVTAAPTVALDPVGPYAAAIGAALAASDETASNPHN